MKFYELVDHDSQKNMVLFTNYAGLSGYRINLVGEELKIEHLFKYKFPYGLVAMHFDNDSGSLLFTNGSKVKILRISETKGFHQIDVGSIN